MDRSRVVHQSHRAAECLTMAHQGYSRSVLTFLRYLLEKDAGSAGDISTRAVILPKQTATAVITVQEDAIVSGMEEVLAFITSECRRKKWKTPRVVFSVHDGGKVKKGDRILVFVWEIRYLLLFERTVLNILQRMMAVSTHVAELKQHIPKNVLLCPTRKGPFPLPDKKACVVGGGGSHRVTLSDAILIKDNHLAAISHDWPLLFGRLSDFMRRRKTPVRFVEVEVESVADALRCLRAGGKFIRGTQRQCPFFLLLDNMTPDEVRRVISSVRRKFPSLPVYFEASGGITPKKLPEYGKTGVDVISMGSITNAVHAVDLSMSLDPT